MTPDPEPSAKEQLSGGPPEGWQAYAENLALKLGQLEAARKSEVKRYSKQLDELRRRIKRKPNPTMNEPLPKTKGELDAIIYEQLTVQLLRLRNEVFRGGGMNQGTFDREYLNGIGQYERVVAAKQNIPINFY